MDGEGYLTQNLGLEGSGHGPASAGRASICKGTLGSHGFLSWAEADCTLGQLHATLEASPFYWTERWGSGPSLDHGGMLLEELEENHNRDKYGSKIEIVMFPI